jgi:hypothetical protein
MEDPSPSERSATPHLDGADRDTTEQQGAALSQLQDSLAPSGAPVVLGESSSAVNATRTRSPSPPRMLFRSTTGKGIAFTAADVNFLVRYLEYYRSKDENVNMVQFWKRIAEKVCGGNNLQFHTKIVMEGSSSFTSILDEVLAKT